MNIAHAANSIASNPAVSGLMKKISDAIILPIISVVFGIAVVVFVWGIFEYFVSSADPVKRATGAQHILWGVIGMFVMVSAYGIIRLIASSIGVGDPF